MGRLRLGWVTIDNKYLYIAAWLAGAVLLGFLIWFISQERLPGYNTDPALKLSFVEPKGQTSEYFTGHITEMETSIIGRKVTVEMDVNNNARTFIVPSNAPIWLGMIIADKEISGRQRIAFQELEKGWRVAAFIGVRNRAIRINILSR